jgi:hypothetical protein
VLWILATSFDVAAAPGWQIPATVETKDSIRDEVIPIVCTARIELSSVQSASRT